jgi:hypothetical protein
MQPDFRRHRRLNTECTIIQPIRNEAPATRIYVEGASRVKWTEDSLILVNDCSALAVKHFLRNKRYCKAQCNSWFNPVSIKLQSDTVIHRSSPEFIVRKEALYHMGVLMEYQQSWYVTVRANAGASNTNTCHQLPTTDPIIKLQQFGRELLL